MQADAPVVHGQKGHGQHQRNGDAHHQAGAHVERPAPVQRLLARALVQPQADEAHRQHNGHRLDQHLDEFIDRIGHRFGLVLDLPQADAQRQGFFNVRGGGGEGLAQRDDVAALAHGDPERNHLLALEVHLDRGRIHIVALDGGNVAQAQLAGAGANRHGAQLFHRLELAGHAHLHHVERRLHGAGGCHRVLLVQLGQHRVEVEPQLGQALLRDFDVELFVLHAKQLDLGHVGHAQQLLAHVFGKGFDLGITEARRLQRVDDAIDITKVVVEKWPHHALRQAGAHVADLVAHLVPDVGHLGAPCLFLDVENDVGFARLGVAADLVGVGHLLQRALELVGDLLGHLLGAGAGPVGVQHHGPEGKGRVFVLAELKVAGGAQHHQHDHQKARQRRVLDGPARQVETLLGMQVGFTHGRLTWRAPR